MFVSPQKAVVRSPTPWRSPGTSCRRPRPERPGTGRHALANVSDDLAPDGAGHAPYSADFGEQRNDRPARGSRRPRRRPGRPESPSRPVERLQLHLLKPLDQAQQVQRSVPRRSKQRLGGASV